MGEDALVQRLRSGDQTAFTEIVQRYHGRLVRFAGTFVARADVAEDVVRETWIAMLRGIDAFEAGASLRTWLFSICADRARTAGLGWTGYDGTGDRAGSGDRPGSGDGWAEGAFSRDGSWLVPPQPWHGASGDGGHLLRAVLRAIMALPDVQRQVVTLRDVEGLTAPEVCDVLGLSEGDQRVLLHRGRAFVRRFVDAEAPQ